MSQAAADALVREGDELFGTEQFAEAAARFERAVSVFPQHALGWRGLGNSLLRLGKPHDAARAFDRAIGARGDSATALWGGALAHAEIGNKIVARDYLRRAIRLQPTWVTMAAATPQLAPYLLISARASDRLTAVLGAFSTQRYEHASNAKHALEIAHLPNVPTVGVHTYLTIGLSNTEWDDRERPHVELIMASTVDTDACVQIIANLAFHLADTKFFPEPGTMVRDVVARVDAGELSKRLPHIYVQSPKIWGIDLPLDIGPPAITLAQVFPISEAEYQEWRRLGGMEFERQLFERQTDVTDLRRGGREQT
jgi:hypothetical protein